MENSDEDIRKYGLRIYTIIKNGPLDKGGAKELSDFIIPSEEVMSRQMNFEEWVQTHANQEVTISLYSLLTKKFRDIKIKTNPIGSKDGVLGASVRKENWTTANKKVLHITSVSDNSFAQKELKLIPFEDYIIGVKLKSHPIIPLNQDDFSPLDILLEAIRKHKGNMMKFYIYNKNNGARDVTVNIGNDYYFTLGCEGAFGALHMFPSLENEENKIKETNGELIKEIKKDETNSNNTQVDNKTNIIENTQISQENQTETKIEKKEINEIKKEEDKKPDENVPPATSNNNQESNNSNNTNEEQNVIENNKEEKKEEEEEKLDEENNETQHNEEQENNKNTIIEEKSVEKEEEKKDEIEEQKNGNGDNIENKEENNEPKEEENKTKEIKEENMLENMIKYKENNENEEKKEEENQEEKKDDDLFGEENNNTNENKNKKRRKKKK